MARKKKEHKISFHIFDSSCMNHRRIITSNYEVTLSLIYKKIPIIPNNLRLLHPL